MRQLAVSSSDLRWSTLSIYIEEFGVEKASKEGRGSKSRYLNRKCYLAELTDRSQSCNREEMDGLYHMNAFYYARPSLSNACRPYYSLRSHSSALYYTYECILRSYISIVPPLFQIIGSRQWKHKKTKCRTRLSLSRLYHYIILALVYMSMMD